MSDHLSGEGPDKGSLRNCNVNILLIKNRTTLPGLEDRLRYILSEELLRRGCRITGQGAELLPRHWQGKGGDFNIKGEVTAFQMNVVAEKSDQAVLYEVNIKTRFQVSLPQGDREFSREFTSPFITDFRGGLTVEDTIASRDREIDRVMRDIAIEVIYWMREIKERELREGGEVTVE